MLRGRTCSTGLIPACAGKTRALAFKHRRKPAHPRVCGENAPSWNQTTDRPGSSPRVRGKRLSPAIRDLAPRLIPACAGKTGRWFVWSFWGPAHPRVCGENVRPRRWPRIRVGSSPRVRGKPRRARARLVRSGLIPACAGKTASRARRALDSPAHPRVCGENLETSESADETTGSSPRMRGKHRRRNRRTVWHGLIPAYAGKTRTRRTVTGGPGAHPRVCGENVVNYIVVDW